MAIQSSSTASSNIEMIKSIYGAFGRGDVAAIVGKLSDDTHWGFAVKDSPVPWHQPANGPDGVARFLSDFVSNVRVSAFEPRAFVAAGDDVMVHVHLEYTIVRSGRPVEEDQIQWWTIRNGRVAGLTHFEDTAQVMSAWAA